MPGPWPNLVLMGSQCIPAYRKEDQSGAYQEANREEEKNEMTVTTSAKPVENYKRL